LGEVSYALVEGCIVIDREGDAVTDMVWEGEGRECWGLEEVGEERALPEFEYVGGRSAAGSV
jgi:hypothetical protein